VAESSGTRSILAIGDRSVRLSRKKYVGISALSSQTSDLAYDAVSQARTSVRAALLQDYFTRRAPNSLLHDVPSELSRLPSGRRSRHSRPGTPGTVALRVPDEQRAMSWPSWAIDNRRCHGGSRNDETDRTLHPPTAGSKASEEKRAQGCQEGTETNHDRC
jgi:hypothetical protein